MNANGNPHPLNIDVKLEIGVQITLFFNLEYFNGIFLAEFLLIMSILVCYGTKKSVHRNWIILRNKDHFSLSVYLLIER